MTSVSGCCQSGGAGSYDCHWKAFIVKSFALRRLQKKTWSCRTWGTLCMRIGREIWASAASNARIWRFRKAAELIRSTRVRARTKVKNLRGPLAGMKGLIENVRYLVLSMIRRGLRLCCCGFGWSVSLSLLWDRQLLSLRSLE